MHNLSYAIWRQARATLTAKNWDNEGKERNLLYIICYWFGFFCEVIKDVCCSCHITSQALLLFQSSRENKKDISNEKQKIKEKYVRKFLKSKESKKVNKTPNHCEKERGKWRPFKIKLRNFGGWEGKQDSVQQGLCAKRYSFPKLLKAFFVYTVLENHKRK